MTSWIIPCNLKNYDVLGAFRKLKKINWKQSAKSIEAGDTVFIYVGKPISAIKYKCRVNKVNLSKRVIDDMEFVVDGDPFIAYGNYMEIELLKEYSDDKYSIEVLNKHGLSGNIQGPRRATGELLSFIESRYEELSLFDDENKLSNRVIEITKVVTDDETEIHEIKPVYVEITQYLGKENIPEQDGFFDVYEGQMFFYRDDGSKKMFSDDYFTNKKNVSFYKVNPVKIIYVSKEKLIILNSDGEGLYCRENLCTYPHLEITDIEPVSGSKNYKDVLFYLHGQNNISSKGRITMGSGCEKVKNDFSSYIEVDQRKIIEADVSERIIVNAGPGTGKTWTLIEKIIYMVKKLEIEAESIQVLCFSRAAVEVIRKRIDQEVDYDNDNLDIKKIDVRTFDSFATQLLYWVRESEYEMIPEDYQIERLNYEERIEKFIDVISEEPDLISECRHFVVDEVQDLVLSRAKMVLTMIKKLPVNCGVTLLGDACQAIYDYQLENNNKSLGFYKEINQLGNFKKFSLVGNHRQTSDLISYSDGYRKYILEEDADKCNDYIESLKDKIPTCKFKRIKKLSEENLSDLFRAGNIAILTRNNAQALTLSGMLREKGIEHSVQRRLTDISLCAWIAIILNKTGKKSYNYAAFSDALMDLNVKGVEEIWDFLSDGRRDISIDTKKILLKIKEAGSCNFLYTGGSQSELVISTIHRSKGREYDQVIILDDLLSDETDSLEEHRVKYVAISRAKRNVFRASMAKIFFATLEDRRCYSGAVSYRTKKRFLINFEVGLKNDLDANYFVSTAGLQSRIRENARELIGKEVYLSKQEQEDKNGSFVLYHVVLKEDNTILGQTSSDFSWDVSQAIREIKGLPNHVKVHHYLYPKEFHGIYITDISSEIAVMRGFEDGVKDFGGLTTWNTIQIEGYATASYKQGADLED